MFSIKKTTISRKESFKIKILKFNESKMKLKSSFYESEIQEKFYKIHNILFMNFRTQLSG